ncbi:hypothetical protein [Clostridium fungisolvens]|uniref:Cxxc_20_cxxc protein n=1 Tax=Clostridium fungisolvens TaxID=1604897 RepID=A0A6V8SHL9_9CLOT|nr:hypothetical protein [Clostridium fungisolvens]GFP76291.1 hypothetical protein bsdtw1_02393 [Clostridium fungisolvens]
MVKVTCPVCKNKWVDKGIRNKYECINCKSKLEMSKFFKSLLIIIPIFTVVIFSITGAIIATHLLPDKEKVIKYIICTLIEGVFAFGATFLLIKIYPNKLSQVKE